MQKLLISLNKNKYSQKIYYFYHILPFEKSDVQKKISKHIIRSFSRPLVHPFVRLSVLPLERHSVP